MFPSSNFKPESSRWVEDIQDSIIAIEKAQPTLDSELAMLQRESRTVLDDVSSQVNAYYTATMAQYPAFQRAISMMEVLGGTTKVVSISAPASANNTVAETWVTVFAQDITIPSSATVAGVRLNSAQFGVYGPSAYYLRYRWRLNGTSEGINTTQWMSRHEFNLSTYSMNPTTPVIHNVSNQFAYWTGAATTTLTLSLQASIQNIATRANAVAAQNITFEALDNNGRDTYLDVMVTL